MAQHGDHFSRGAARLIIPHDRMHAEMRCQVVDRFLVGLALDADDGERRHEARRAGLSRIGARGWARPFEIAMCLRVGRMGPIK
jgi:hypothetical protein